MESPILYNNTKFGGIYINRAALECMLQLEEKVGEGLFNWINSAVTACAIENSFVANETYRGRPVITQVDVERVMDFYHRLR